MLNFLIFYFLYFINLCSWVHYCFFLSFFSFLNSDTVLSVAQDYYCWGWPLIHGNSSVSASTMPWLELHPMPTYFLHVLHMFIHVTVSVTQYHEKSSLGRKDLLMLTVWGYSPSCWGRHRCGSLRSFLILHPKARVTNTHIQTIFFSWYSPESQLRERCPHKMSLPKPIYLVKIIPHSPIRDPSLRTFCSSSRWQLR